MAASCEACNRRFKTQTAFRKHLRYSPAHAVKFECEPCHRTFDSEQALQQHLQYSPAHAVTFDCESCDWAFDSEQALQQHLQNSPAHAITFDCEPCDWAFDSEQALQQYLRDSPAHAITFDCEPCDRAFDSERALQQHLQHSPFHTLERSWSMHPSLHDDVSRLLVADGVSVGFHQSNVFEDCIECYNTNIMGRFTCRNRACSTEGWSSKQIAITIRLYRGDRYNAVVWHQRCQSCDSIGWPTLDDTYGERIAYRLKKWFRIEVEKPYYSGESKGPHRSNLCEGCKNGQCKGQT